MSDIVLGAGIVGTSIALHLQARGRDVVLLDKGTPGAGTSYGNAGLIERSDLMPRAFPRQLAQIAHYAMGTDMRMQMDRMFMLSLAPWLAQYWWHSAPRRVAAIARDIEPLFIHCLDALKELMQEADALHLLRDDGWLSLFQQGSLDQAVMQGVTRARDRGMTVDVLGTEEIQAREPALQKKFANAVHWRDAASLSDPGELTRLLVALFVQRGGAVARGDAATLLRKGNGWSVRGAEGDIAGKNAVVALGPWAGDLTQRLGYRFPLAVKRGYHMHYELPEEQRPRLPIIDMDHGFVLSPMAGGMRLTTAIEFAHRDARPNPRQLWRAEPLARQIIPFGDRLDEKPWLGSRPFTADMRPIIGPAPRHKGLWFAFGHAHHGLTLSAITGRLLAEQMTGEKPFLPLAPFFPSRFERAG